jgi:predicted metal-dependent enzyme (double-stranded beta helix superfamily)
MTSQKERDTYSVDSFARDVKRIIKGKGTGLLALEAIGTNLRRLVMEGGDLTKQGTETAGGEAGIPGRLLYQDPEGAFRLGLGYFAAEKPTPVHSHYRWGVECVVSGQERFTVWERTDPGDQPGKAQLKVISDGQIKRGDVRVWYDPPGNIHRQWAKGDGPVCLVILMGGDGKRQYHFDLEKGTYQDAPARPG